MNVYDVQARIRPIERVNAMTSWDARKAYAERHGVAVSDVMARRVNIPDSWRGTLQNERAWPGTLQGQLLPKD